MAALSILCIGDSLTAGSTAGTEHPYAHRLRSILDQAFPDHEIDCQVEGKHGDQVTQGGFEERMEAACKTNSLFHVDNAVCRVAETTNCQGPSPTGLSTLQ